MSAVRPDELNSADAREWLRLARGGDFASAWRVSDRIRGRTAGRHNVLLPRHQQQIWSGRSLAGQRVLIRCYHGLGDTIQFIRYAAPVKAIAQHVTVWAQPSLLPILRTAAGIDRLVALHDGAFDSPYDEDIEVMELPYAFRTTLHDVPASVPYLHAARRSVDGRGLRVGLVWRAGEWDRTRSVPFRDLRTLIAGAQASWYALQLQVRPDEQSGDVRLLETGSVVALAEAMRGLDLVVSIDSMPAHLAGALAVPVWTLLPYDADWRWMLRRDDTPWYPTMRLFRQPRPGDWVAVLTEVARALREGPALHSGAC